MVSASAVPSAAPPPLPPRQLPKSYPLPESPEATRIHQVMQNFLSKAKLGDIHSLSVTNRVQKVLDDNPKMTFVEVYQVMSAFFGERKITAGQLRVYPGRGLAAYVLVDGKSTSFRLALSSYGQERTRAVVWSDEQSLKKRYPDKKQRLFTGETLCCYLDDWCRMRSANFIEDFSKLDQTHPLTKFPWQIKLAAPETTDESCA